MSHTITIKCEFQNKGVLGDAVKKMGGTVLGEATHQMFHTQTSKGFGFKLPGWQFPIVLQADGTLAYDDYNGGWGNVKDLETLKNEYQASMAVQACEAQGWLSQRENDGSVTVFHPSGATLTITTDGVIDANGFQGTGCKGAVEMIAAALGQTIDATVKPEAAIAFQNAQQVA